VANVSKLIFVAAIAGVSIATPAVAAHRGSTVFAHQNGYVTRGGQGSGVYNVVPPPLGNDPASRPYHYDPINAPNGP
jgi:hypothetical protein